MKFLLVKLRDVVKIRARFALHDDKKIDIVSLRHPRPT